MVLAAFRHWVEQVRAGTPVFFFMDIHVNKGKLSKKKILNFQYYGRGLLTSRKVVYILVFIFFSV